VARGRPSGSKTISPSGSTTWSNISGEEDDQLRLDLSREMRTQRGFDHAEDFRPVSLRCPSRGSRSTF